MRDKNSDPSKAETSKAPSSAPAVGSLEWYEAVEERSDARVEKLRAWRNANGLERKQTPET